MLIIVKTVFRVCVQYAKVGEIFYLAFFNERKNVVKRIALTSLFLLNLFPSTSIATESPRTLSLSEAITLAAEKNLEVRAERFNPAQYEAEILLNQSIYDPILNLQTSYGSDATKWSGASDINQFNLNSSLSKGFWTGGTGTISFSNAYSGTSTKDQWQSKLGVSINQPLLKNSGREATELTITTSRLSKFASLEKLKTKLSTTIAQVKIEYYKLYTVREQLEVKKVSLALAQKILSETKARVAAGVLPAMEILNAEFGAVSREKELIDAEQSVKDQADVLKLLLQLDVTGDIKTTDLPTKEKIVLNEQTAIAKAILRPDIREQKRNLEISELQTKVFNNKLRPDLSINASAGITGQGNEYQKNFEKMTTFNNPVWSIGLNLTYPLGNSAAENDYRKNKLKSEQLETQIKNLEENAANEVRTSIRSVETGYKQIEVADRGRSFAEERLRAFIRKNEVGLATTKDVLDVENDLATAKINQLTALVGYNNALTNLWRVTGELLEREGITMIEGDSDKLYRAIR